MVTRISLAAALIAAMSPALVSCQQLECGEGTMEQDGECVTGVAIEPGDCGPGTHYDAAEGGSCVPDLPPTQCDPETTTPVPDPETGVITCQGTGGGCSIPCPPPGPGNVSLCGKLFDVENDTAIEDLVDADGTNCDDVEATDGPCALSVAFYPALPFANDPSGTPALEPVSFRLNNCGRFAAEVEEPMLGFMAIGIDDADGLPDTWALAGVALPAPEGTLRNDLIVYGLRHDTDAAWTTSANLVGQTFVERGVYVPIFQHGDSAPDSGSPPVPAEDVVVLEDGAPDAAHTYYFTDTDPHIRLMPDGPAAAAGGTLDATSVNGSALMTDSMLVDHSGTGGEPAGCKWPEDLAAAGGNLVGVAFIQRRVAITDDLAEDVCP